MGIKNDANPYVRIFVDGVCMYKHRHVMQQHLGRELTSEEIIHHIDGDKINNALSNLMIVTGQEHMILHYREAKAERSKYQMPLLW